jgi:phage anti-repressor protein
VLKCRGEGEVRGSGDMLPRENFEFLDSFERYFTYFRTRFEEKGQLQNVVFKSPNAVRSKKILM